MLDAYLSKKVVQDFIKELKSNSIFSSMTAHKETKYDKYINDELALYSFYNVLLKYKIIVDDEILFADFMDQVQKLFRKLKQYDDLVLGTNKILCNFVARHLKINDIYSQENKEKIVIYIYNKYIRDGYYFHGFSTIFENNIKEKGFVIDNYPNYYSDLNKVNDIFSKYGVSNIMKKDFSQSKVYFTDDFIMGCNYSICSPNYFYNLLFNDEVYGKNINDKSFFEGDYLLSIKYLKRFMSNNLFSEKDKNEVLNVTSDVWNYFHRVPKKISVLVVKRSSIDESNKYNINDFLSKDINLYETIDRILSPKYGSIVFDKALTSRDVEVISLENYYEEKKLNNKSLKVSFNEKANKNSINVNNEFLNTYGNASFFIILGSLMISLGVIITIVTILGGM